MPTIEHLFRIHEQRILLLSYNHGLYLLDTSRGIEHFISSLLSLVKFEMHRLYSITNIAWYFLILIIRWYTPHQLERTNLT